MDQWKILVGKIILELIRGTGRREDSHRLSCPQLRAGQTLVPGDVPQVASIGKCRAPRVNVDSLGARYCVTECIYSIYPGTKV